MISNRCYYALKAVLELSKREGEGLATISEIAKAQDIPTRFLEAILVQLKQNGYAQSVRGKEGGYELSKPARKISVGEIVRLFESPLFDIRGSARGSRKDSVPGVFSEIWRDAETAAWSVFDEVNFAELVDKQNILEAGSSANYII